MSNEKRNLALQKLIMQEQRYSISDKAKTELITNSQKRRFLATAANI